LTPQQESALAKKQKQKRSALTVPRRPAWTPSTTPNELEHAEKDAFLEWRRGLAYLQESDDLLLTPFERNLEVWRQLWRVIERSDLVVQIVDARNPLLFRTEDLEKYVLEVDVGKRNLLLVNKADLMTLEQRCGWADWFDGQGIRFAFYSARLAKEAQEQESESDDDENGDLAEELVEEVDGLSIDELQDTPDSVSPELVDSEPDAPEPVDDSNIDKSNTPGVTPESFAALDNITEDPRTRILTVDELESLFIRESPPPKGT
jgi:large subunit GTPase 1